MKNWTRLAMAGLLMLSAACSSDDGDSAADTTASNNGFSGGLFALETFEVSDQCLDGGLDLVFMPNGTDAPYTLTENNELPGESALPSTQTIKLQSPFDAMQVEFTAGSAGSMLIRDGAQVDVVVDGEQWGDCRADMSIDADITIVDNDNVTIAATVNVTAWKDGATADDACPAADPCTVTLSMRGSRAQ